MKKIYFTEFDSGKWKIYLAASDKGVVKISYGASSKFDFFAWLEDKFPGYMFEKNDSRTSAYASNIKKYINGKIKKLDIPIDLQANGFTKKVLTKLKKVPYGKTVTYGELAAMAGNPRASRAAGTACSKNPIPLVIPCHRVIAAGGRIGKYGGGERLKRKLLENEGVLGLKD
ncbi:MAG TPA: methylated-DNA--[protein]-cysteine S-methyltransferase [candidate division Zixibacteria bacterium]|nr:methylated-DNA--[protein]-cysteine S-methyltransferase [candidate division Zixibacteria bacterium]HEQ98159.1 methylated-DNA--[protein]-cysteine S-methyltransferase [candidate division Zixibacteria bacterium]